MQVAFGFTSPIPWDKAPNGFGQKTFAVDPSGCVVEEDDWRTSVACVGSQLLMLAIHEGIIELEDLQGLALGQVFTLFDLVSKRDVEAAREIKDMYVASSTPRIISCNTCVRVFMRGPHGACM